MIQFIVIGLLVMLALIYLGRTVVLSFRGKASCGSGCAKCQVGDTVK